MREVGGREFGTEGGRLGGREGGWEGGRMGGRERNLVVGKYAKINYFASCLNV